MVSSGLPRVERSEHENKFDRQLRLWGKHGQAALESASVLVLGAGPLASETTKNLLLPNVKKFTMVDQYNVRAEDLGNNFFVEPTAIGRPRAEVVCELLMEMAPGSQGTAIVAEPQNWIETNLKQCLSFTLVIATEMPVFALSQLAEALYERNIPLVLLKASGLVGSVRVAHTEACIVESHPENDRTDLCLHPSQLVLFPELNALLEKFDLNTTDLAEHSHIPFMAILVHCVREWEKQNNGILPKSAAEIKQFRELIMSFALDSNMEENFDEAMKFVHHAIRDPALRIDPMVRLVLADPRGVSEMALLPDADLFWVLVAAVNAFIAKEKMFPVSPELPDMTTDSASYRSLAQVFHDRFERDVNIIGEEARTMLSHIGRSQDEITVDQVRLFVKNVRNLAVVRFRSLQDEQSCDSHSKETVQEFLLEENMTDDMSGDEETMVDSVRLHDIHWYLGMRTAEEFLSQHRRYPNQNDIEELVSLQNALFERLSLPAQNARKEALEEL